MPHHRTFRRLSQKLSLPWLGEQAQAFLAARPSPEERHYNLGGKTLRGTITGVETHGRHLLAIQQAGMNLVLAQTPVDEKRNEIGAAPKLLKSPKEKGAGALWRRICLSPDVLNQWREEDRTRGPRSLQYGHCWLL
jgi:hypothetical protein